MQDDFKLTIEVILLLQKRFKNHLYMEVI